MYTVPTRWTDTEMSTITKVAHSPYFASLDALCSAILSFGEKMNDTDQRVVKVLLDYWSRMMSRVRKHQCPERWVIEYLTDLGGASI